MICEACHGKGSITAPATRDEAQHGLNDVWPGDPYPFPCRECGGSGVTHCCDGLREEATDER